MVSYFLNRALLVGADDLNVTILQNKIIDGLTVNLVMKVTTEIDAASNINTQNTLTYIKNTYLAIILTIIIALLTKDTLVFYTM